MPQHPSALPDPTPPLSAAVSDLLKKRHGEEVLLESIGLLHIILEATSASGTVTWRDLDNLIADVKSQMKTINLLEEAGIVIVECDPTHPDDIGRSTIKVVDTALVELWNAARIAP